MTILTMEINPASPVPIYHQVSEQLQDAISRGDLVKGDFLPSEVLLAEQWGISRPTARRAIQDLVDKGLLVRKRGVGTQVVNARVQRSVRLSSLFDDLAAAGSKPTSVVQHWALDTANSEVATALDLTVGAPVMQLRRLRIADMLPLAIMVNWIIPEVCQGVTAAALQEHGLYEILRASRVRPRIAHQVIGARMSTAEEAAMLKISSGAPLLTMRRVMQDDSGRSIELGSHAYNATRYSVEMTVVDS